MKLLLDTHIILWAAGAPERLSAQARTLLTDAGNDLAFSVASLWEIVIKRALGRDDFQVEAGRLRRGLLQNRYGELAVTGEHALAAGRLPPLHKDPFDRMLVAQSLVEGMTLVTGDPLVARYPAAIRRV